MCVGNVNFKWQKESGIELGSPTTNNHCAMLWTNQNETYSSFVFPTLGPGRTHWCWAGRLLLGCLPGSSQPGREFPGPAHRVQHKGPHRADTCRNAESCHPRIFVHRISTGEWDPLLCGLRDQEKLASLTSAGPNSRRGRLPCGSGNWMASGSFCVDFQAVQWPPHHGASSSRGLPKCCKMLPYLTSITMTT